MARSLTQFFLNPVVNIYYLIIKDDFHQNYFYFTICEIINLTIDFFFYLYNEYIVLYYCGLEHDTEDEIILRSLDGEIHNLRFETEDDFLEDNNSNVTDLGLNEIYK